MEHYGANSKMFCFSNARARQPIFSYLLVNRDANSLEVNHIHGLISLRISKVSSCARLCGRVWGFRTCRSCSSFVTLQDRMLTDFTMVYNICDRILSEYGTGVKERNCPEHLQICWDKGRSLQDDTTRCQTVVCCTHMAFT